MNRTDRPLSPHLGIYRWPITMTLSILHRGTGIALAVGLVALVFWLQSMAAGADAYRLAMTWLTSPLGKLLLLGWSFSFFFHLANGVRHLFWDVGLGFEKHQARASAWFVLVASTLLTVIFWFAI